MINFKFGYKDEFLSLKQAHDSALQAINKEFKRMTDVLFETYPNLKTIAWNDIGSEVIINNHRFYSSDWKWMEKITKVNHGTGLEHIECSEIIKLIDDATNQIPSEFRAHYLSEYYFRERTDADIRELTNSEYRELKSKNYD
jgi:hypothetical protein